MEEVSHNQTLEINTSHKMIVKLNKLRKLDEARANKVSKQMIDTILLKSAIPIDMQKSAVGQLEIIDDYLA